MKKLAFIVVLLFISIFGSAQSKYFVIKGTIFDIDAMVIITKSIDSACALAKQTYPDITKQDFDNRGVVFFKEGYPPILWIPGVPKTIDEFSVLNHEIFHLISAILGWAGVPLGKDSEEVYAYMTQYYSNVIYTYIKK